MQNSFLTGANIVLGLSRPARICLDFLNDEVCTLGARLDSLHRRVRVLHIVPDFPNENIRLSNIVFNLLHQGSCTKVSTNLDKKKLESHSHLI